MRITKAQLNKILNLVSIECKTMNNLDMEKVEAITNKYIPYAESIEFKDDIYSIKLDVIYELPKDYFVKTKRLGINLFEVKTTYIEFNIIEIPFDNLILVDCNLCHVFDDKTVKLLIGEKTLARVA